MVKRESKRAATLTVALLLALTGVTSCAGRATDTAPQGGEVAEKRRSTQEGIVGMREFSAAPDQLPSCYRGARDATAYRLPGSSGRGRMVTVGSGPRGVVFAPISWGDACEWASEAKRLAAGGYHVVTFDWGRDRRRTVSDATRLLRSRGTSNVAWVGGCMGGTLMLGMLTDRTARPIGVAGISPLASLGGYSAGSGASYKGELLLLGTADDPLSDEGKLREVARSFPEAEVTVLPGTLHAAEIVTGPHGDTARRSLDGFLDRTFAPVPG
ncbi:alpha/beta hydrolase [Streptomyces angustmyceticus]|uniref:alpha/beta hydrolase n=1 Tax=Streptomyces angustmyceticus TaxID=285578 RepID=UPI0037FA7510